MNGFWLMGAKRPLEPILKTRKCKLPLFYLDFHLDTIMLGRLIIIFMYKNQSILEIFILVVDEFLLLIKYITSMTQYESQINMLK